MPRNILLVTLVAFVVLGLSACGGDHSNPNNPIGGADAGFNPGQGTTGKISFSTTDPALGALGITSVQMAVTGSGIAAPLTGAGSISGNTASGTVDDVPVGNDRSLNVKLLGGATLVAEKTSQNIMVLGGAETTVHPTFSFPAFVVINEISVNPPWMELHNKGTAPASLEGWKFDLTGFNPANPTFNVTGSYTFGAVSIPAGGYLVVNGGTGADTATDLYFGRTILWTYDTSTSMSNKGSAKIADATGKDVDFVCWVNLPVGSTPTSIWSSTSAVPAFSQGMSIGRTGGADTNASADWGVKAKTKGEVNP